mgnify:CR=1 FL=1
MPKLVSEVINGKTYTSLAQISREFGLSSKTVYGRHYRGEHGAELVRKPIKGATKRHGVYFELDGTEYKSINSISKALGISYTAVKHQFDKNPDPEIFKKNILEFAKTHSKSTTAITSEATTPEKSETKQDIIPIQELREPSMQKVGALASLLLSFVGEFTGYKLNVPKFENAYDKGLDLSLSQFIEESDDASPKQNIISTETLSKIEKLESTIKDFQDQFSQYNSIINDQSAEIVDLKETVSKLTSPKRHWWSK